MTYNVIAHVNNPFTERLMRSLPSDKNTWFTADWHLNHSRIIELCERPFSSVEEMNEAIIANHNTLVAPGDDVFVLGDVALGSIDQMARLVQRMNGRKFLVPGNHDRCWRGNKRIRGIDTQRYIDAGFQILSGVVVWSETGWVLCHFPSKGDSHTEDRFLEYRPSVSEDDWLIHGHVHEKWQVNGRQINVGVDVWDFKPVSAMEIAQIIELSTNG
jgi:calcineurin-like phosphoesterase family protein